MEQVQRLHNLLSGTSRATINPVRALTVDYPIDRRRPAAPKVSVIIPTLNEAKNLPLVLPYLPMDWIDEVILVDGRSTDGTVDVARNLMPTIKVVLETRRGKGAAMKAGYRAAEGDILIVVDADGSNDPREIPRFIQLLIQGADMVKGSRFATGGGTTDMPLVRRMGNGAFVLAVNVLFGSSWTDLCYGYHAFWRYCLDQFDLSDVDGFEIDTALYLRAAMSELHVLEVPSFEGYRFHGVGKLQTIPDGFRVLKTIFREWMRTRGKTEHERYLGFRGFLPANQANLAHLQNLSTSDQANLQFLQTLNSILAAGFSLTDVIIRVLQQALSAVEASSGSLFILDDKGSLYDGCLSYCGEVQGLCATSISDVIEQGVAGWVFKHREPVLISNTTEDPRWLRRDWDTDQSPGRSALVMPLEVNENRLGILTLIRPQVNEFTNEDLKRLESNSFQI